MDGEAARLLDASLTGFRAVVMTPLGPQVGARCRVRVEGEDGEVEVEVAVRSRRLVRGPIGEEHVLGLEVLPGQLGAQAELSRALFRAAQAEVGELLPVSLPQQRLGVGAVSPMQALSEGVA